MESHARFAAENSPDVTLLADADAAVAKAYDVFLGIGASGVAKRGYFLVDATRTIRFKYLEGGSVMPNQTQTLLGAAAELDS